MDFVVHKLDDTVVQANVKKGGPTAEFQTTSKVIE